MTTKTLAKKANEVKRSPIIGSYIGRVIFNPNKPKITIKSVEIFSTKN